MARKNKTVAKNNVHFANRRGESGRLTVTSISSVIPAKEESRVWTPDRVRVTDHSRKADKNFGNCYDRRSTGNAVLVGKG